MVPSWNAVRSTGNPFVSDKCSSCTHWQSAAAAGFRFTDARSGFVSIINLASVRAIEEWLGVPVDPLRFRANIYVDGMQPWAEFDLVGRVLQDSNGLALKITKPIVRCAAVNVDPVTAERDLDIPATLLRRLGHMDCGVYAQVRSGGELVRGAELAAAPDLFDA